MPGEGGRQGVSYRGGLRSTRHLRIPGSGATMVSGTIGGGSTPIAQRELVVIAPSLMGWSDTVGQQSRAVNLDTMDRSLPTRVERAMGPPIGPSPDTSVSVPTVSQWGLAMMACMLLVAGTVVLRRGDAGSHRFNQQPCPGGLLYRHRSHPRRVRPGRAFRLGLRERQP